MGLNMDRRHLDNGIPPQMVEFHGLASTDMILYDIQAMSRNYHYCKRPSTPDGGMIITPKSNTNFSSKN